MPDGAMKSWGATGMVNAAQAALALFREAEATCREATQIAQSKLTYRLSEFQNDDRATLH